MGVLLEKVVQERAHQYLQKRYKKKARGGRLYAQLEARTKRRYGGKRADAVLAFRHWWRGLYVVSMEAKSIKTLHAIRPNHSQRRWWRNVFTAGLLLCLATGAYAALFKMDDGLFQFLLPLNVVILGGILYGLLTIDSTRHQMMPVIDQLAQYPANEKWLAFSKESVQTLPSSQQKDLRKLCRHRGIGLLLIKKRGRPEIWTTPQRHWKWWGDYLQYYSREKEMRKTLG